VVIERVVKKPNGKKTVRIAEPEVETVKSIKPRSRPRATVEEVEDSDDEKVLAPRQEELGNELPFRNVGELVDPPMAEVLPRRRTDAPLADSRTVGKRKTRTPRNTEVEDQATAGLLGSIRDITVPVKLGDLLDSNPKIRRALVTDPLKTRRQNFVRNTEGDVLATKVQTFMTSRVYEESDESSEETDSEEGYEQNVRMEETTIQRIGEDGEVLGVLMLDTYPEIVTSTDHELEEGSFIMPDPVAQYFDSLKPGEKANEIRMPVASMSGSLRCLYPRVGGKHIEALLDSGSQTLSIGRKAAEKRGIEWDTNRTITMLAANNTTHSTLGLAKNVLMGFSKGFRVYAQLHVVEAAPYELLLGRPFDMIMEALVKSKKNGDVDITLTDPYSGRQLTLPTYPRGHILDTELLDGNVPAASATSTVPQDF
jgi:hypothetical protein